MGQIPGLNFTIRHSLDRLQKQHLVYNEEFVQRLKLSFGHPDYFGALSSPGIVDPLDPASALAGDSRPLTVSANADNQLTVDINPGLAVTGSGLWILLNDFQRQLALADLTVGVANVVYLRYFTASSDPQLNDKKDFVVPFTFRIPDVQFPELTESAKVGIDTTDVFGGFSAAILEDLVPLAIVTIQSVQDPDTGVFSSQLVIDQTRDQFTFNRPWFSPVDIEHRSQVGTGVVSSRNAHGLSQNELTSGDFSPFQLQLDHGVVVTNDRTLGKIPGLRCQVSIPYSLIKTDDASGSATGFALKKYIELPNFPIRVGRVWTESTETDIAALHVETTNRIVFASDDPVVDESVGVLYTKVDAVEPPVGINEIIFQTNNPATEEFIVAGGLGHTQLSSTTESFADASRYPMIYDLFVDEDATIRRTPQVIFCLKKLDTIGTSDTPDITQYGPAKIMMGLLDATDVATMSVKIRVFGKDVSGTDIDHLFTFTGPTWSDPGPVPNAAIPSTAWKESLRISTQVFSEINNVVIEERIDDGPNAAIMIWATLKPSSDQTYDKMKDGCLISEIVWDGLRMAQVRDKRIVGTTVRDFLFHEGRHPSLDMLVQAVAGGNATRYLEDFRVPRFHNLLHIFEETNTAPTFLLLDSIDANAPWYNMSRLNVGLQGYYRTVALPVRSGSGLVWRVTLLPKRAESFTPHNFAVPKLAHYFTTWKLVTMTPVPGFDNTFEAVLEDIPTQIEVLLEQVEHFSAMLIHG